MYSVCRLSVRFFLAKIVLIRILGFIMVIRMRSTRSHTGNRRSHHALKANTIVTDKKTGVPHLRHRASLETGMYRDRNVVDVVKKAAKQAKKAQQ